MLEALEELFKDKIAEKREEGREEGREEIIANTLSKGYTPEQIADFIGIPLEEVLKIQESLLTKS